MKTTVTRDDIESQLNTFDNREAWLDARRDSIGASEIAAVLGQDPRDPGGLAVWARLRGLPIEGIEHTDFMEYGHHAEAGILSYAEKKLRERDPHMKVVHYENVMLQTSLGRCKIHASPDALCYREVREGGKLRQLLLGGIDAKNVSYWGARAKHPLDRWGDPGTDAVPRRVMAQCVLSAFLFDVPWWHAWAAIGGEPPAKFPIQPRPELGERLLASLQAWHERFILRGERPELTGSMGSQIVAALYPEAKSRTKLPATPEALDLGYRLAVAKLNKTNAVAEEQEVKTRLEVLIGDAYGIEGVCTWSNVKGRAFTNHDAIYAELRTMLGTQVVDELVQKHSGRGPASRSLRCNYKLPEEAP